MALRDIQGLQALYFSPHDDLVGEVIIPCLTVATIYNCMTAFFHSNSLQELAPGMAEFLHQPEGRIRLIISPHLSPEDQRAIAEGHSESIDIVTASLRETLGVAAITADALTRHTLACLSYLIATARIDIRIAVMRSGLFHPKVRLFSDGTDWVVVHGSSNETSSGLTRNYEQIGVVQSWKGVEQHAVTTRFREQFERIWADELQDLMLVATFPEALRRDLIQAYPVHAPPTAQDYRKALRQYRRPTPNDEDFSLPAGLNYTTGLYVHQGEAVAAWEAAGRRGILEMATGAGKTRTALIAAKRLFDEHHPLLLVIAVPYRPLVAQWAREVATFGVLPIVLRTEIGRRGKLDRVQRAIRRLEYASSRVECLVITQDFLCDPDLHTELRCFYGNQLLIADEVHHLGASAFLRNLPEWFAYRLGLSATPVRQYDPAGTATLTDYFGEVVFRFTLREAIGTCLVPYDYYVHPVLLTAAEMEEWARLTAQLRSRGWIAHQPAESDDGEIGKAVQILLNKRRRVLDTAAGKLVALKVLLSSAKSSSIQHALVYCTDKDPQQLRDVNEMLMDQLHLRVHQITQQESGDPRRTAEILESFADGWSVQVLTAKRVLDEGLDIPEVRVAYILASTTVARQWVQRRGRVLRRCPRLHKQHATIHDFLVLPPHGSGDSEMRSILLGELRRISEFAGLARNQFAPDGPISVIRPLMDKYVGRLPAPSGGING